MHEKPVLGKSDASCYCKGLMTTPKKSTGTAKKSAPKASSAPASKNTAEEKVAKSVLDLIDQAAATLRKTVRSSASNTEKVREEAHKKAHSLLSQAHSTLSKTVDDGASVLEKAVKKIKP